MSWKNIQKFAVLPLTMVALGTPAQAGESPLSFLSDWFFDAVKAHGMASDIRAAVKKFDAKNKGSLLLFNGSAGDWRFGLISDPANPLLKTQLKDGKSFGGMQVARVIYVSKTKSYDLGPEEPLPDDKTTVKLEARMDEIAITPTESKYARLGYFQDENGTRVYVTITPDASGKQPRLGLAGITSAEAKAQDGITFAEAMTQKVIQYSDETLKNLNRVQIEAFKLKKKKE